MPADHSAPGSLTMSELRTSLSRKPAMPMPKPILALASVGCSKAPLVLYGCRNGASFPGWLYRGAGPCATSLGKDLVTHLPVKTGADRTDEQLDPTGEAGQDEGAA